jgi:Ca2+-binding RTX toxin-like protein
VHGGDGDDFLALAQGDDEGNGGIGSDIVIGGFGVDNIDGGAGADNLHGGQGSDAVKGGGGNDTLNGDIPNNPEELQPTEDPNPNVDRCLGQGGFDTSYFCESNADVENVEENPGGGEV